jgi:uncharacterized protein YciI
MPARRTLEEPPRMPEFVIFLRPAAAAARPAHEDVRAHVEHLTRLETAGRLIAAGPFENAALGGMVIGVFADRSEACRFAAADPFVQRGYRLPDVQGWAWSRRENGHLGVLPPRA